MVVRDMLILDILIVVVVDVDVVCGTQEQLVYLLLFTLLSVVQPA